MDAQPPSTDELVGAARLSGALVDLFTTPVQETHRGVAQRVFGLLGPVASPVRAVHDVVADVSYGAVRVGAQAVGGLSGVGLGLTGGGRDRRPISANPRGALAVAFFNGLLGDQLDGRADDLVIRPRFADAGTGVATNRIVVFVHGLAETPVAWSWWSDAAEPYAPRLAAHGWTPIDFTYDTGRTVAESGAALSELLEDLVDGWPEPVDELALVGHSMGGLVVRAACVAGLGGSAAPATWVDHVTHVVTLAAPHAGSWLARAAHGGSAAAQRLPETRGLTAFLELRSHGIRDLTFGAIGVPDLAERMPHAQHSFVTAALPAPIDALFGDGLVHRSSASAPAGDQSNVVVRHYAGVGHIRLLNHRAVGDDLESWLGPATDRHAGRARVG